MQVIFINIIKIKKFMKKLVFMVMMFFLGNSQCSGVDRKRRSENSTGTECLGIWNRDYRNL
jgi:hypothetical protein